MKEKEGKKENDVEIKQITITTATTFTAMDSENSA